MKLFALHMRSLVNALGRIIRSPMEHVLSIMVMSLIIAVLMAVVVISNSAQKWQQNNINYPQIMIYLKDNTKAEQVSALENMINRYNPQLIKNYQFISKDQGLQELQQDQQLKSIASDVLSSESNPLPDVLVVNTLNANPKQLNQLSARISHEQIVDNVQIDTNYAGKVSDLLGFVKRISTFLQVFFAIVLILVVYNMIRLQMLIRHTEITVSRLIGASDSFIMRPLTYYATIQVVIASLVAFSLVNWFTKFLNSLFLNLNTLFGKTFLLDNLNLTHFGEFVLVLIIFSIFAVFLAVQWVFRFQGADN